MSAPAVESFPALGRLISVEAFDALPRDNTVRREIENGRLLEVNRPAGAHARAAARLVRVLDPQLPDGLEAFSEPSAALDNGPSPRRVPDVVVGPDDWTDSTLAGHEIALAIEIVSPGESAARDYIAKPREYAAAGIPVTWVVDIQQDRTTLTEYTLDETGQYHFSAPVTGVFSGQVAGVTVTVDLDTLTGPKQ